jgi:hypothetical protein
MFNTLDYAATGLVTCESAHGEPKDTRPKVLKGSRKPAPKYSWADVMGLNERVDFAACGKQLVRGEYAGLKRFNTVRRDKSRGQ